MILKNGVGTKRILAKGLTRISTTKEDTLKCLKTPKKVVKGANKLLV